MNMKVFNVCQAYKLLQNRYEFRAELFFPGKKKQNKTIAFAFYVMGAGFQDVAFLTFASVYEVWVG